MIGIRTTDGRHAIIESYETPVRRGQERTLAIIRAYIQAHGYAPTLPELARLAGSGRTTVKYHRDQLVKAGKLRIIPRTTRGMVVVE